MPQKLLPIGRDGNLYYPLDKSPAGTPSTDDAQEVRRSSRKSKATFHADGEPIAKRLKSVDAAEQVDTTVSPVKQELVEDTPTVVCAVADKLTPQQLERIVGIKTEPIERDGMPTGAPVSSNAPLPIHPVLASPLLAETPKAIVPVKTAEMPVKPIG